MRLKSGGELLLFVRSQWDRVAGVALIIAGAVALVLGYIGVSGSPYVAEELAYIISGGIGGLFLLGLGATLLISADLQDEWRKLDRIEAALQNDVSESQQEGSGRSPTSPANTRRDRLMSSATALSASRVMPKLNLRFREASLALLVGVAGGLGVIIAGWNRAATVADPKPAIHGVAVAMAGLILAAIVAMIYTLWLKGLLRLRRSWLLGPLALADYLSTLPAAALQSPNGRLELDEVAAASRLRSRRPKEASGALKSAPARRPFVLKGPETLSVLAAPEPSSSVLFARGLSHFHREGCPVIANEATRSVARDKAPKRLTPCELCQP